jgi:hypothetical protein
MSAGKIAVGWRRRVERGWDELVDDVADALAQRDKRRALRSISADLVNATLVVPERVRSELRSAPAVVEAAVAEEQVEAPQDEPLGVHVVTMLNLANALECTGLHVPKATVATLVGWLPRVAAKRDDEMAFYYWSIGFAALAVDDRATYRRFAAADRTSALPFKAGETFGFNLQGLLHHLAAAVEHRASLATVQPAWDELLAHFDTHWEAHSLKEGTLLWVARIVHDRIGGHELGSVAVRLRDAIDRDVMS